MTQVKLKINRQQVDVLVGILDETVRAMSARIQPTHNTDKLILSLLSDSVVPKLKKKLVSPVPIKSLGFKAFEAEAVLIACRNYEIATRDPLEIAIIQTVKTSIR